VILATCILMMICICNACHSVVETHISLGLHSRILPHSIHPSTLVQRISLAHMCTYLFSQIGLARSHDSHIHPSIHLCPAGVYWCIFTYYSLLSNIGLALHTHYCALRVYNLILHIFMPIFSLLSLCTQACMPSDA
jgi:hypothetical protein